jgi:hypothetical protein
VQRQFWNAFKHATIRDGKERDDRKVLERFNDLQNDHTLFVAWYDYMLGVKSMPVEVQGFQALKYFFGSSQTIAPRSKEGAEKGDSRRRV